MSIQEFAENWAQTGGGADTAEIRVAPWGVLFLWGPDMGSLCEALVVEGSGFALYGDVPPDFAGSPVGEPSWRGSLGEIWERSQTALRESGRLA